MRQECFHITIGSSPAPELTLENDMRLVKAALLYADKVKLCSFTSSIVLTMIAFTEQTPRQQIEFLESVQPLLMTQKGDADSLLEVLRLYKDLARKKHPTKQDLLIKLRLQGIIGKAWVDMRQTIIQMIENSGADALIQAIQSNLLEMHVFGASSNTDSTGMVEEYVEILSQTVSDCGTYPLFDDQTGDLVRAGLRDGVFTVSEDGIARGKQSALAGRLIERLPLFEEATVDEVLDIRRELQRPLTRFRSAVIGFSENIKNASWDKAFEFEAGQVFLRDIEPAILDIEDAVKSNSYLASLARRFVDKPLTFASGSALTLLMSQLSSLPHVISQALPVGVASAAVAYDAYRDWKEKNLKVEQNCLFFYYRAKQRLAE